MIPRSLTAFIVGAVLTAPLSAGPFPRPIVDTSDVSITTTNNSGVAANDWHVRIEDPADQPEGDSITVRPPNPGSSAGIGTVFETTEPFPGDLDAYMDIFFGVAIPNGGTITIAWNMPDSSWEIEEHYFTADGARIGLTGPGSSARGNLDEAATAVALILDNPMGAFERDRHGGGVSGSIIISDMGYRLSPMRLPLSDLSFSDLVGLGVTPIPGTLTLAMGAEEMLPPIALGGNEFLQLAYRVQWDGDPGSEALMGIQFRVPEPALASALAVGALAVLSRRRQ